MIGKRLKQVREENGYSQVEIAKKLGKNQNTISSWETGRTQPKLKELHALCDLYNCTYEYLTGTKQHDSKDVTLDDILTKLWDFDISELKEISHHIEMIIEKQQQILQIEYERDMLNAKLQAFERQLSDLKNTNATTGEGSR